MFGRDALPITPSKPKRDEHENGLANVEAKLGGPSRNADEIGYASIHLNMVKMGGDEGEEHKDECVGGAFAVAFGEQADAEDDFGDSCDGVEKFGEGEVGRDHGDEHVRQNEVQDTDDDEADGCVELKGFFNSREHGCGCWCRYEFDYILQ